MEKKTEQELLAEIEALQNTGAELTKANSEFATQVAELREQNAALAADKESADKTVASLLEQLSIAANGGAETAASSVKVATETKAPTLPEPFELDGKIIQFMKPAFNLNGVDYTAAQAAAQPELLAALLAVEGQNIAKVN